MFQEKTIFCDHFNCQAKVWNDNQSTPILALHGWLDNAASFDCIAPLLKNYHIVAVDLPGHGLSPHKPKGSRYHYLDYVNDVYEIIKYFGWEKVSSWDTLWGQVYQHFMQEFFLIKFTN